MAIRQSLINSLERVDRQDRFEHNLNSLLEGLRDDPSMDGWSQTQGPPTPINGINFADIHTLRRQSNVSFYRDAHGRGIIRTLTKFIIGSGSLIDFTEMNRGRKKKILKWWRKVQRTIKWFSFQREFVTRAFRDGEVFVWRFSPAPAMDDEGNPIPAISRVRFIEPGEVEDILTDEGDVENVLGYKIFNITTGDGPKGSIAPEHIVHCKIMVDRNVKRGRPILEPILPYLTKYGKWLDARMILSIVRTSVALVQEVNGPSTDLFRLRNAQTSNKGNPLESDKAKMLRPGTIIRGTPGVKYSMLSPNLDAKDAAEDGRTLLLASASAAGLPDAFVTADYQHLNFASMTVAQNPAIREFEDWQMFFGEALTDIVAWFMEDGVECGQLDTATDTDFDVAFPPIIRRDLGQETTAYQTMNQAGVLSRRTWQLKAGFDPDDETEQISSEAPPVTATPPNDPNADQQPPKQSKKDPSNRSPRQNVTGSEAAEQKTEVVFIKGSGKTIQQKRVLLNYSVQPETANGAGQSDQQIEQENGGGE